MKPLSLQERLGHFLKEVPGAESIEELEFTPEQRNCKRADFFFQKRTIIAELKNLETDASPKIEKLIRVAQVKHRVPLYWAGVVPLSSLLRNFPNREELNQQILVSITSSVRGAIEAANRQIRETKRAYNLPNSEGLLILGNEGVLNLSPTVIAWCVNYLFTKRTREGELRYLEINAVWMIVENYFVNLDDGRKAVPSFTMGQHLLPGSGNALSFANSIQRRWGEVHGAPVVEMLGRNIDGLRFHCRQR